MILELATVLAINDLNKTQTLPIVQTQKIQQQIEDKKKAEEEAKRLEALQAQLALEQQQVPVSTQYTVKTPVKTVSGTSGNTYTYGYCTWYVKNRRPDLPNNLGNADTWAYRAAAQGIPTGYTPQAGAVGQKGMHVVYVESVNSDGSMTISEMNFEGWNVQSSRTISPSGWRFIY